MSLLVLAPLLFFGILEAGLRLGGYGYPTGFFLGPDADGNCATNYRFGWRFFPPAIAKGPQPYLLPAKPAGAVRIVVLGSSAAMGTPDPSFSFGRILEVMLREQYPGVKFEVVNGAITAINSHVALEIARDFTAHEPDLFVVYMGNNEVVGPYGPGTIFQKWSPSLKMIRASLWAKSTRIGQLLGNVAGSFHRDAEAPSRWRGMEMFINNPVTADDPRLPAVYDSYRRNLTDICGIARRAGAGVVLSTVAVNLRDCPPLASLHRSDLTDEDLAKWDSIYKAAGELEANNRWDEALGQYEAAAKIDDRFAELSFRIGECLVKTNRFAEARDRFELARELDVLRFRADSHINASIREVAGEQAAAGVCFVDAERALAESDPNSHGIPGGNLFYEHVHLTFDGDYLLARAFFDQVCEALPQLAGLRKQGEIPSRQRCTELLALTPWDEYKLVDSMWAMTARPPFTNQLNHSLRQAVVRRQRDDLLRAASKPEALRAALRTYEAALARSPNDADLHRLRGRWAMHWGRPKVAAEHLQIAAKMRPGDVWIQCDFGNALAAQGQVEAAIAEYQKALEIKPDLELAYNNLGLARASQGRVDEAIAHYEKALEIKPDFEIAHNNLGLVLAGRRQFDEAIAHYQKALEINPEYADVCFNHALALEQLGKLPEAIVCLKKVLEIKPEDAETNFKLGVILSQTDKIPEAIGYYEQAVRFKPDYADAHYNLALAFRKTGKATEANGHFEQAVRIKPEYAKKFPLLAAALAEARKANEIFERCEKAVRDKPADPEAQNNLGGLLRQRGRVQEAIGHFEEALRIKPDFAGAHYNLAMALSQAGKFPEAVGHYTEALRLKPDFLPALNNLAWIRATHEDVKLRDGAEAVRLAEHACKITRRKEGGLLDTLAATYAEAGRFPDAVTTAEEAIALARSAKQTAIIDDIQSRLTLYRAGKPYREVILSQGDATKKN